MANQYSLSHLTLLDCSIPELTYIAARCGYDSISPRLQPMGIHSECPFPPLQPAMVKAARHAISITGMQIHSIEIARITDDIAIRDYESAIEVGAELGATKMIASIWTQQASLSQKLEKFIELCQLAQQYNMTIALEYPTIASVSTLSMAQQILQQARQPNTEILIDTLYVNLSRTPLTELEQIDTASISFIQIADVHPGIPDTQEGLLHLVRDARLYPGEGSVDFAGIISRLPPVNYAIEIPNRSRINELGLEGHARKALQASKQVLNEISQSFNDQLVSNHY